MFDTNLSITMKIRTTCISSGLILFLAITGCSLFAADKVDVYTTTPDRTEDFSHRQINFVKNASQTGVIEINKSKHFQEMDGFGAAVTGSTAYNLMQMKPGERTKFLQETFSPRKGMGYSYIRVSIGCSDFSLSEYTCCDQKGIEHFSLQQEEKEYVIPILKEILQINPKLKILGSPWTCPKWMKVNNLDEKKPFDSWTSGQLNPAYYNDYATYFVKWIQAFEKEGIPIYSVTPQNEPLNRGNSASLYMGWREQKEFIKTALGPQIKKAGLQTRIYAFDHNYNYDRIQEEQDYPLHLYEDKETAAYLAGAAYHNYSGDVEELNKIHNAYPDKELLFTEASIGEWNDGRNLQARLIDDMVYLGLKNVQNWCKGVIVWNLMLDSERGPNREKGCRSCYGAVDIDKSNYKTITRNSHYYIIAHLAKVVKPGAVRIESKGSKTPELEYCAFQNPDGSIAFVVTNSSKQPQNITLHDGKKYISHILPAEAVASFCWK